MCIPCVCVCVCCVRSRKMVDKYLDCSYPCIKVEMADIPGSRASISNIRMKTALTAFDQHRAVYFRSSCILLRHSLTRVQVRGMPLEYRRCGDSESSWSSILGPVYKRGTLSIVSVAGILFQGKLIRVSDLSDSLRDAASTFDCFQSSGLPETIRVDSHIIHIHSSHVRHAARDARRGTEYARR